MSLLWFRRFNGTNVAFLSERNESEKIARLRVSALTDESDKFSINNNYLVKDFFSPEKLTRLDDRMQQRTSARARSKLEFVVLSS